MAPADIRTHEISFCARVKSWADELFREHPDLPFKRVEIEETLSKTRKRSDLRIYDRANKLVLAGEVKLPGTFEGRDPYHHALVEDAYRKADQAQAQFFFTWNVNRLVLFDRSLWDKSLYEKRIQEYDLGLNLQTPMTSDVPASKQPFKDSLPRFSPNLPRSYPVQNPIGAWRRTNISFAPLTAIFHGPLSSLPNSCSRSRNRTRDSMHNYRNGWHASKDGL